MFDIIVTLEKLELDVDRTRAIHKYDISTLHFQAEGKKAENNDFLDVEVGNITDKVSVTVIVSANLCLTPDRSIL